MYEHNASPAAAGSVLVLRHFDAFFMQEPNAARVLLDAFARAARMGLLMGHRMLCLVQSDDPKIVLPRVGASPVMWNPAEWLTANRQS
jgi:hypothetical protein